MKGFKRRRIGLWRALLVLLTLCGLMLTALIRCRPVVTAFAESQASWMVTDIANETVAMVLEEQAELCRSIISVSYNEQKTLSSVITDTAAINTIRTTATHRIIEQMEGLSTISVGIPMGTLVGFDWLSGWGPLVPFTMSVTCGIVSGVSSDMEAVGINQSNYQVFLDLHINVYVVTPGGRSSVTVDFSYPMAQAVLLGDVPDNLTEVYGDDQDTIGEIFDYGTIND